MSRMPFEEFRRQLDLMRTNLEAEKKKAWENDDSTATAELQLSALNVVENSAHQMTDNGEVFEV